MSEPRVIVFKRKMLKIPFEKHQREPHASGSLPGAYSAWDTREDQSIMELLTRNKFFCHLAENRDHGETAMEDFVVLQFLEVLRVIGLEAKRVPAQVSWHHTSWEFTTGGTSQAITRQIFDGAQCSHGRRPERA